LQTFFHRFITFMQLAVLP